MGESVGRRLLAACWKAARIISGPLVVLLPVLLQSRTSISPPRIFALILLQLHATSCNFLQHRQYQQPLRCHPHPLQTPAPSPPFHSLSPTTATCARRIPDLSAVSRRRGKLPATALKGPSPSAATQSSAWPTRCCCCKSGLIHVPRCSTPPTPLLRRHRPSSDRPAAALSSCSQRRPLHSRQLPACVPCIIRFASPSQTSRAAPLPPNRRLYSSR
jgi:hypothetical protein